jgi:toxin ParE1/3/4
MPDRRYRLSEAADADLESLYEWGIDRFGVNAADRYFEGLIARLGEIADTPQLWPEVDHIRAGYRRSVYVAHAIYYPRRGQRRDDRARSRPSKSANRPAGKLVQKARRSVSGPQARSLCAN